MNPKIRYLIAAVWAVVAAIVWATAVPSVASVSTFLWVNVAVVGLAVGLSAILRDGTPTRSLGGILYDTEHPQARR